MKRFQICVLALVMLMVPGYAKEIPDVDREIDICLNAYEGVVSVLKEDWEGNLLPCEYGSISVLGAAGEPIVNGFISSGILNIEAVCEGNSFEGWMECVYDDEIGNYVIVSEELYSTAELLALSVPEQSVEYVAKWASIPMMDYFAADEEYAFEDAYTSGTFAFTANGGSILFHSYNDEEYKSVSYGYGLEYGQALNDVMGTEYGDSIIGIEKEGAEFTGWTLYMAESIFWSNEPSEEEDMTSVVFNESGSGGQYALLRNATLIGENMPTEQLCGMTCYGENYLAVANWAE